MKLTKTELRSEQLKLGQLQKYLPTLQLKKALLQLEVNTAQVEIEELKVQYHGLEEKVAHYGSLLSDPEASDLFAAIEIVDVKKRYENIAGIDIPHFDGIVYKEEAYSLFDSPVWIESAIDGMKHLLTCREKIKIVKEKKRVLEKELREVSIRVNLFEKILIPRAVENIKKIKIFLGDQQLAAISQAKVAKQKILMRHSA